VQAVVAKGDADVSFGPPESADLVLTFRNFHNWVGDPEMTKILAASFAVLKHGGVLTHAGRQQVGRPSAFTLQSAGRAGAPCEGCWPWAAAVSGCVPLLFRQCSGHLLPHHVVSVSARHACSCSAGVFLGV